MILHGTTCQNVAVKQIWCRSCFCKDKGDLKSMLMVVLMHCKFLLAQLRGVWHVDTWEMDLVVMNNLTAPLKTLIALLAASWIQTCIALLVSSSAGCSRYISVGWVFFPLWGYLFAFCSYTLIAKSSHIILMKILSPFCFLKAALGNKPLLEIELWY